jgi:hypothetical protein
MRCAISAVRSVAVRVVWEVHGLIVFRRYATSPVSLMMPCIYREFIIRLIRWYASLGLTVMRLNADEEDLQLLMMIKRHHAEICSQERTGDHDVH